MANCNNKIKANIAIEIVTDIPRIDQILKTKQLTNKVFVNIEEKSITIRDLPLFLNKTKEGDSRTRDTALDRYRAKDNNIAIIIRREKNIMA